MQVSVCSSHVEPPVQGFPLWDEQVVFAHRSLPLQKSISLQEALFGVCTHPEGWHISSVHELSSLHPRRTH